jgi:chromate reductase, NAD(P)H dehydrogenase (quinone)
LEIFDLSDIPPFNQDLETNMPAKVKEFKSKIRKSDAPLIATPEYNYSVPGVLKNAIDYASMMGQVSLLLISRLSSTSS